MGKKAKISDLVFDDKNFNKHTEFGMALIEKSLRNNGAGRSILIDKNNRIIGGNGVVEAAGQIGLEDVQIVETDGTKIIAVKRTDIDLDSKQGREMAIADNATGAADLAWDTEAIADISAEFDIDVSSWGVFADDLELDDDIFNNLREGGFSTGLTEDAGVFQKSFVFPVKYRDNIDGFIKKNGTKDITKKIIELCLNAGVK